MNLTKLINDGNLPAILIIIVLAIITGGVGKAIVDNFAASKRGVKVDSIASEQNGITGFTNLSAAQEKYIATLSDRMTNMEKRINELEGKLEAEITYSNVLINTLSENTIPIPPRPKEQPGKK